MKTIIMCLTVAIASIWGWYQPVLLPYEKFGILFIVTAFVGGCIIGKIGIEFTKAFDD